MSVATLPNFGQRVTARRRAPEDHEISLDGFAGVGGWGLGDELATGYAIDIAFNHDPLAVGAYRVNHPGTRVLHSDAFEVHPLSADVEPGRPMAHAHFSPDCTDFSKARGMAPVSDRVRGLAWIILAWMHHRRPRVVTLENVEEFRDWGPTKETKRGRMPIKSKRGETFAAFIACITTGLPAGHPATAEIMAVLHPLGVPLESLHRGMGYEVDHRELRACDFGAPTIRKRFFLIARCDGESIIWPEATHGEGRSRSLRGGRCQEARTSEASLGLCGQHNRRTGERDSVPDSRRGQRVCTTTDDRRRRSRTLKPYRTAAECIDWSIPCPSIFMTAEEAKEYYRLTGTRVIRPLKPNTLKRIANGVRRFVLEAAEPFIISVAHSTTTGRGPNVWSAGEPIRTLTSSRDYALVTPLIVGPGGPDFKPRSAGAPLNTILRKANQAVVAPYLVPRYGERDGQSPRCRGVDEPSPTIVPSGNGASLVAAFIARHFGGMTAKDIRDPFPTATGRATQNQVVGVHLMHNTSGHAGGAADAPLHTLTSGGHVGLVASHMMQMRGTCQDGRPLGEPLATLTGGGNHAALIATFLQTYYSQGSGKKGRAIDQPAPTVTTKDRVGLVTVMIAGEPYVIVDIGMRMLQPHELLRCQFGEYADGWVLAGTKTQQVAGIGNSVCPHVARAIVQANVQIRRVDREVAA